jgi:hypothetical protein
MFRPHPRAWFLTRRPMPSTYPRNSIPFRDRLHVRINDVVDACGMSRATVNRLIQSGKLKTKKVNGCRLIEVSSVLELGESTDVNAA